MSEPDLTGQTLDGRYRITGLLDTAPTTPPRASEPSVRATSGPHLASDAPTGVPVPHSRVPTEPAPGAKPVETPAEPPRAPASSIKTLVAGSISAPISSRASTTEARPVPMQRPTPKPARRWLALTLGAIVLVSSASIAITLVLLDDESLPSEGKPSSAATDDHEAGEPSIELDRAPDYPGADVPST